jgi:hypothetical protein
MSKKSKKTLAIICGIVLGLLATVYGTVEFIHSRQLAARGKTTTGEILETEDKVSRRFRTHTFYVRVRFQPDGGPIIQKKVSVDEGVFQAARSNASVKVFYLADDPTICAVGETVKLRYGHLLMGVVFLFGAGYLLVFFKAPADEDEAVESIQEGIKNLTKLKHEYASVDTRRFRHLDLTFYEGMQKNLEAHGFRHLVDEENLSLRQRTVPRTFIRVLIGPDNATMAAIYHFRPGWMLGVLGAKDAKVLDLETQFSNGCFVCTGNAEMAGKLDSPPEINAMHLPAATTWDMLLEAHRRRISGYLAAHSDAEAIKLTSIDDVHRSQDEQQRIKAEYRKKTGISKDELQRIAGESSKEIDRLHDALTKTRAQI